MDVEEPTGIDSKLIELEWQLRKKGLGPVEDSDVPSDASRPSSYPPLVSPSSPRVAPSPGHSERPLTSAPAIRSDPRKKKVGAVSASPHPKTQSPASATASGAGTSRDKSPATSRPPIHDQVRGAAAGGMVSARRRSSSTITLEGVPATARYEQQGLSALNTENGHRTAPVERNGSVGGSRARDEDETSRERRREEVPKWRLVTKSKVRPSSVR
ncbi:hypothetical protein BDK51DRAFT_50253 [Blyttiomyces helicus]|uniref:Uncharacterized protein n=1 Tax=Blyttiomyces helicus TaxID=388810 RepID=A0A4P9VU93_9FUNG|nr:hypothetical protein BDK51DRAFT_50253 [Blyttiomyces helicus]|eukprot:RKO83149.1 hypothetical protein BDK51DRAFT_50253 [Blyttiomyces helicus]